jgi:hypothetical protein
MQDKKKLRLDVHHLQGFIAGAVVVAMLSAVVSDGLPSGFLQGTFTSQVGGQTLQNEVDLLEAACEPAILNAASIIDAKIMIDVEEKSLIKIDRKNIGLNGYFEGLEVVSAGFEDGRLAVHVKGTPKTTHISGDETGMVNGDIYMLPGMVAKDNTAYRASVKMQYPRLSSSGEALTENENCDEILKLTLSKDEFIRTPEGKDLSLSGGFSGMTADNIRIDGQVLVLGIKGKLSANDGNGIITVANVLKSGLSVDETVKIAGTPSLFSITPITVEEPGDETLLLNLENDFFAETVTSSMFTFGGELHDAKISRVERTDTDMSIKITIRAPSFRNVGKGTIQLAKEAVKSGRVISGDLFIQNPQIYAFEDTALPPEAPAGTHVFNIFANDDDFLPYVGTSDFVLKDSLAGLSVKNVEWMSGYRVRMTATGEIQGGSGIISVRSAAMGGVTGAEAMVYGAANLGVLDMKATNAAARIPAMLEGKTGGFLDSVLDWGISKVKDLVIEGIKSGLKAGAEKGLMFFLRQIGLVGPPIEDMLKNIQASIDSLQIQTANMEDRVIAAIGGSELQTRFAMLKTQESVIDLMYDKYMGLTGIIKDFKAKNPDKDPSDNPEIKDALDRFAGENGDLKAANLDVCVITISNALKGDGKGATPLITSYYNVMKNTLPFEHNAAEKLRAFMQEMTLLQAKGLLLYAEYCNYNGSRNKTYFDNNLAVLTEKLDEGLNAQQALLPNVDVLNIRKGTVPGDIIVKCNGDGKQYLFTDDAPTVRTMIGIVNHKVEGSWNTAAIPYYTNDPWRVILFKDRWGSAWDGTAGTESLLFSKSPFAFPASSDIRSLFNYHDLYYQGISRKTYLSTYVQGINGLVDWMFISQEPMSTSWVFYNEVSYQEYMYDLSNGSYFAKDSWDLYERFKDYNMKIVLVQK